MQGLRFPVLHLMHILHCEDTLDFLCIDVETANESYASIDNVAVSGFMEGVHRPDQENEWRVDPEEEAAPFIISRHYGKSLTSPATLNFADLYATLEPFLRGKPVLHYGPYVRMSLSRAAAKYGLPPIKADWLDALHVIRRAWPEFRAATYRSLHEISDFCEWRPGGFVGGVYDARACGEVFLRAYNTAGIVGQAWHELATMGKTKRINHQEGNGDGRLVGEVVVFTGRLSMPRSSIAALALEEGCTVDQGVTKHTTLVVVGLQDVNCLAGKDVSAKHEKARELAAKGKPIRIIGETDFLSLLHPEADSAAAVRD